MTWPEHRPLARDATIGILGGGQLGRMIALAAAKLGLKCHVFAPETDSPAFDVVRRSTCADYSDEAALERFARDVDVVTYEFENVPGPAAAFLAARVPVLPDVTALEITQDRLKEKEFVAALGIPTARFAAVDDAAALAPAVARIGLPAIVKTRRFGYDGKGQMLLRETPDFGAVWREIGAQPSIVESFVPFMCEVSVVAARDRAGSVVCYDVCENEHRDHVLKSTRVPSRLSPALAREACAIAGRIADALGYVGVLAVEMFVVAETVLVNEIAPRVHNSGHWTLDGDAVSQFEQHVRAVAGWPLGAPQRRGRIEMVNLLGDEIDEVPRWLAEPGASLHLYGKQAVRPGRKMGHVTRVLPETGR